MRRALRPPAALAMLAAVVAGCSGAPAGTGGGAAASAHEQAVKFAECMRDHGVSGFPDPSPSGAGAFTVDGVLNGSSLDPSSPVWKRAMSACKHLEPPGFTGGKVTAGQRTARLEFARCVRDNGVPDFPDPTPNGPLVDTNRIPSASAPGGMSILHAAMQRCRDFAAAAGVTGGR